LVAYAAYYRKTIYLVFEHAYWVVSYRNDFSLNDELVILRQTRMHPKYGGSYYWEQSPTPELIASIHKTKIPIEHYQKPFKGVSAYRMPELEDFARKMGILEESKKYKKAELYEKVVSTCCESLSGNLAKEGSHSLNGVKNGVMKNIKTGTIHPLQQN